MAITIERNQKIHSLQIIDNICVCVCVTTQQRYIRERCITIKRTTQMLKLLKIQKILKNHMIHYLEIIETKQNIYDLTIEKYKIKMGYIQNSNP